LSIGVHIDRHGLRHLIFFCSLCPGTEVGSGPSPPRRAPEGARRPPARSSSWAGTHCSGSCPRDAAKASDTSFRAVTASTFPHRSFPEFFQGLQLGPKKVDRLLYCARAQSTFLKIEIKNRGHAACGSVRKRGGMHRSPKTPKSQRANTGQTRGGDLGRLSFLGWKSANPGQEPGDPDKIEPALKG
jgi:hypothetical protein